MRELIYIEECESTNAKLSSLRKSKNDAKEFLIYADYQTAGKGQGGAFWESEKAKNLTFSYNLVDIDLSAYNQFYISIITALTLTEIIEDKIGDKEVKIKWPNDIYIGSKKVAGILIENVIIGDKIKESYIGIGLNVNQEKFSSKAPNPISIINYTEKKIDIKELLSSYLLGFEYYLGLLNNGELDRLKTMYLDKLYRINEVGKYQINDEIIEGFINGIDEYGFLRMSIDGQERSFDIKEIVYL